MKHLTPKLIAAAVIVVAAGLAFASQVRALERPYVAAVGDDTSVSDFYISRSLQRFASPDSGVDEVFGVSRGAIFAQAEVCDNESPDHPGVNVNALIRAPESGDYTWIIKLPRKPIGNLNITLQCGILYPNARDIYGRRAIDICAGETGIKLSEVSLCKRAPELPNESSIEQRVLPRITAIASVPFENPDFAPFNLTAYRNPSRYGFTSQDVSECPPASPNECLRNSKSMQVLDGSKYTRVSLKTCMTKTISVRKPVMGQINALGQEEWELEAGHLIRVRMDLPRHHPMDVYCHEHSVTIQGLGAFP